MKKLLVLFVVFLLTGCQSTEEGFDHMDKKISKISSIAVDLEELSSFNDSLLSYSSSKSRSLWGNILATVSADVMGIYGGFKASVGAAAFITAATGGTAGPVTAIAVLASSGLIGAGASYGAYKGCTLLAVPDAEFYDMTFESIFSNVNLVNNKISRFESLVLEHDFNQVDVANIVLDEDFCLLTANLHNDIIDSILVNRMLRTNLDPFIPISPVEEYSIPLFTTSEVRNMGLRTNNVLKEYYNTHNYEEALFDMNQNGLASNEASSILKLFLDALLIFDEEEELNLIISQYMSVVSNSENLTVMDKNALIISFITAKRSFELWENQMGN